MEVAVLGLGEAGGRIASDLVAAGCVVRGFDPARRPEGIPHAESAAKAVANAEVVLSINAAAVALEIATDVAGALGAGVLYADLNTSAPALKHELAETVPVLFVDVALVGVVPASGLRTPALASGAGAERFAGLFRPLGMPVEVVGPRPGDAAGLKLLRSVFMKGIAAAAIESLQAARGRGCRTARACRHRRGAGGAAARPVARGQPRTRCAPGRRDARGRRVRGAARRRATRVGGGRRLARAAARRAGVALAALSPGRGGGWRSASGSTVAPRA